MKLNDPFGRVAARKEQEYQSLCKSLQKANIDTKQQAEQVLENIRRRGWIFAGLIGITTLLLILFFPEGQVLFLVVAMVFAIWLYNTSRNGNAYVRRYMDEVLKE